MEEKKLHQLWQQGGFEGCRLKSVCGTSLLVVRTGRLNTGDGPDFKEAEFRTTGGLRICGDVEIHVREEDWQAHGHHTDGAYNATVVHLVLHTGRVRARTASNHAPYTISLKPFVAGAGIVKESHLEKLPCGDLPASAGPVATSQQLDRARQEYFTRKVNDLMEFWPRSLPIEDSWKITLATAFADGLGISHNRGPMRRLAQSCREELCRRNSQILGQEAFFNLLKKRSGLYGPSGLLSRQEWDLSGPRPGNKPAGRMQQLSEFLAALAGLSRRDVLRAPEKCWEMFAGSNLGSGRYGLLRVTVWLPACYLLGTVTQASTLQRYGWMQWEAQRLSPPAGVQKLFAESGFSEAEVGSHLGAVYQLRHYCRAGRCGQCSVGIEALRAGGEAG